MTSHQLIQKSMLSAANKWLLKLDREASCLEVLKRVSNDRLENYYSLRDDFDSSEYALFEKERELKCIFGGTNTPTPTGLFRIERKSDDEYISGYYPKLDKVKFFGYLVIFEDYFIHSDLYEVGVDKDSLDITEPISGGDSATAGCIRVSREDLGWLLENIDCGTMVIM
ncbi:MAG: L,D-transpeptidase [Oscillospiraceae bacterium]